MYNDLLSSLQYNDVKLNHIEPLKFSMDSSDILNLLNTMKVGEFFICEEGGLPKDSTYFLTIVRVKDGLYVFNSGVIGYWKADFDLPVYIKNDPEDIDFKEIVVAIGHENLYINQYHYCDLMLEKFWEKVFGKSASKMGCGGMVSAHGDKAYSYKSGWEKENIPFNRGVLIFLLTYTSELDREKWQSSEFVIDKYEHYLPLIESVEKEVFY